jgi:hypothetical protein
MTGVTGPNLLFGSLTGTNPNCGMLSGTPGVIFIFPSSSGPSGSFSFVQIVSSDTVTNGSGSCSSSGGLDLSYPYPLNSGVAADAPFFLIASGLSSASRNFHATMWLMWTPTATPSITVPIGYQSWGDIGSSSLSGSTWTPSTTGGNNSSSFTTASGAITSSTSHPTWSSLSVCQ